MQNRPRPLRISVVLPSFQTAHIGGYHVHYTYAQGLAARGHRVRIVIPRFLSPSYGLKSAIGTVLWARGLRSAHRPLITTFPLDRRVAVDLVRDLDAHSLPDADILLATAYQTSDALRHAPPRKGTKIQIAYDYEHWMSADAETRAKIERAFHAGFRVIASSTAVRDMLCAMGVHSEAIVPCGINTSEFGCDLPQDQRASLTVGFPVRREPFKGTQDAIECTKLLRDRYGDNFVATAFGSDRTDLPEWITWVERPSAEALRALYNRQKVVVMPSHYEGWGLTGIEAMACGCAVVCADNGGSRDYARDRETALVVPPMRPDLLAQAVSTLFDDFSLCSGLAARGQRCAEKYTWKQSTDEIENILFRLCEAAP